MCACVLGYKCAGWRLVMMMRVPRLRHLPAVRPPPLSSPSHLLPPRLSPNQGKCQSRALFLFPLQQVTHVPFISFIIFVVYRVDTKTTTAVDGVVNEPVPPKEEEEEEEAAPEPVKQDSPPGSVTETDSFEHMKPGCTKVATPLPELIPECVQAVCTETEPEDSDVSGQDDTPLVELTPAIPTPISPTPASPAPASPVPESPAPVSLTPESPAPASLVPVSPAPVSAVTEITVKTEPEPEPEPEPSPKPR